MRREFVWLSTQGALPVQWDLRALGWEMRAGGEAQRADRIIPTLIDCRAGSVLVLRKAVPFFRNCAAIGVESGRDRAALLEHGVGEALSGATSVAELSARMGRIAGRLEMLPRHRSAGPLRLDLFHRDALLEKRWIGLHPREFNLLWRLAGTPGVRVSRHALLREVWRIDHVPETNSLPVHVSRLRAKLGVFGLAWLIETDPADGYRLAASSAERYANKGKGGGAQAALDRPALLRDEGCRSHEQEGYAHAVE